MVRSIIQAHFIKIQPGMSEQEKKRQRICLRRNPPAKKKF